MLYTIKNTKFWVSQREDTSTSPVTIMVSRYITLITIKEYVWKVNGQICEQLKGFDVLSSEER